MARWAFVCAVVFISIGSIAQCPPNIGFELGNVSHWDCASGSISKTGVITLNSSSPDDDRQKIIQNTSSGKQELDPYGKFPVNCPNGSGYSLRLGNSGTGAEAESISYTFTIPAGKDYYSIIYNYAVVLQNPGHDPYQQPKFTARVFDVSANSYITCSSFDYTSGSGLPGFETAAGTSGVVYKPWSPVTIKLVGYAGKTIRLEFTTNDCTVGGHFGYAYLDVDDDCSSPIKGTVTCPGDQNMIMRAPYGFASYRWFPADFSTLLGTSDTLKYFPIPPQGTGFAVELTPYPEQGCLDTVYATIRYSADTVKLILPAAPVAGCLNVSISDSLLTAGSSQGLTLSYYLDPELTQHLFQPSTVGLSGTYYIKAVNEDGCYAEKPVIVQVYPQPVFSLPAATQSVVRPNTLNLSSLITGADPTLIYTFWRDTLATIPLADPDNIGKDGTYYIKATTTDGCYKISAVTLKVEDPTVALSNAFTPNGDGINDTWTSTALSLYDACTVEIFSRAGQPVFRSVGYTKPWDGKLNGKDLPVGTYYYVIRLKPEWTPFGGSVTIIR